MSHTMTKESCFILGTGSFNSLEQEPLIGLDSILGTLFPMNIIIKRMIKVSKVNEKLTIYCFYMHQEMCISMHQVCMFTYIERCASPYIPRSIDTLPRSVCLYDIYREVWKLSVYALIGVCIYAESFNLF